MTFQIVLGGINFRIICNYGTTKDYFFDFLTNDIKSEVSITINQNDILEAWKVSQYYDGNDLSIKSKWYEPTLERQAIERKIVEVLPTYSMLLMHGVAISDGTSSYIFSAPSGTGKSSRAQLFIKRHSNYFILNGDKPILKVLDDVILSCGSPWKGKEHYGVNIEAPLKAIYLLERAEHTEVFPISVAASFDTLLRQTYISTSEDNLYRTLQLIKALEGRVNLFRFQSSFDTESMETAVRAANDSNFTF